MTYNANELSNDLDAQSQPEKAVKAARREGNPTSNKRRKTSQDEFNGVSWPALMRHIVLLVLLAASIAIGYWRREDVLPYLGWSAVPVGMWIGVFAYLLIAQTSWLIKRIRETVSSAVIVLGIVAVLGIYNAHLGAISGTSMGGTLGEYLVREPFDWNRYDISIWHHIQAWARVGLLFAIGLWGQFPAGFATALMIAFVGIMMGISKSIEFVSSTFSRASTPKRLNSEESMDATDEPQIVPPTESKLAQPYSATEITPIRAGATEPRADYNPSIASMHNLSTNVAKPSHQPPAGESISERRTVFGMGETLYPQADDGAAVLNAAHAFGDSAVNKDDSDGWIMPDAKPIGMASSAAVAVAERYPHEAGPERAHNSMTVAEDGITFSKEVRARVDEPERMLRVDGIDESAESTPNGSRIERESSALPWRLPPTEYIAEPPGGGVNADEIESTSRLIEETLAQHAVNVSVDQVQVGPTVTMYGLKPGWKGGGRSGASAQRVRVDTILNREKDIALALGCPNIRFESVVPGASVVGIEVPNSSPTSVNLRSILDTPQWESFASDAGLPVPMGMGSGGDPVMADFSKMPHTLVAGATGSGKSVCMNTIVSGILLCRTPLEVRMVMIDPKRVELTPYEGIPHLYTPVIVDPDRAVTVLKALIKEMMDRFATLESARVKNIASYNERAKVKMPYLLILVDELADLMLTSSNEVEQLIVRLAQLGRATGVHLVIATQRPSVDVVTGLIKANFPSRVSFSVMSQVDSRTILDSIGAEKLLGKGDMLYKPIDLSKPMRVQGAYIAEDEIEAVVEYWKNRADGPPLPQLEIDVDYDDHIPGISPVPQSSSNGDDNLLDAALELSRNQKTLSTSLLQRRLKIGYPRAARLIDELEEAGIVGPGQPGKPRQVL